MLRFDHIAIAAESLEAGVAWVEARWPDASAGR